MSNSVSTHPIVLSKRWKTVLLCSDHRIIKHHPIVYRPGCIIRSTNEHSNKAVFRKGPLDAHCLFRVSDQTRFVLCFIKILNFSNLINLTNQCLV